MPFMATINFEHDSVVDEPDDSLTLLQISLKHNIPHVHVCGGMARCSTCRVMVLEHPENLSPRNAAERALATRLGFEENIRLACQSHATGPVSVRRLTLDDRDAGLWLASEQRTTGREAKLAVLFSDIRGFTNFAEHSLPYDITHILNRYFFQMGEAVLAHGGYIDKYVGDGMMALFGMNNSDGELNCRNAVNAALQMLSELEGFNAYMLRNFNHEFKIGIGIHYGEMVIGELGHPVRKQVTVIGDAVNMASRIETATKEVGASLLISDSVKANLRGRVDIGRTFDAMLKGKTGSHTLHEVLNLREETVKFNRLAMVGAWVSSALRSVVTLRNAPLFLRAAFHEGGSYDNVTKTGGARGTLRLPEVYSLPEHKGMEKVVDLLKPVKASFPDVSWADLFALAGAVAVKIAGGPVINVPLGRTDGDTPPPVGVMDLVPFNFQQIKERFVRMGLNTQELVVLSGAHTLGHNKDVPFTQDWFKFNNSFFKLLLNGGEGAAGMLPSDIAMTQDPECFQWVKKYALSEEAFFEDFTAAYVKMSKLGTELP